MPRTLKEPDQNRYSGRVAARIRELRTALGITVEDLAAKLTKAGYDVKPPTLYHWENGTREPALDAVPYLAKALKVSVAELLPAK